MDQYLNNDASFEFNSLLLILNMKRCHLKGFNNLINETWKLNFTSSLISFLYIKTRRGGTIAYMKAFQQTPNIKELNNYRSTKGLQQ